MKNLFIIAFLFIGFTSFAQEDVKVKGNTITIRETAPIWPGCEKTKDSKTCFNQNLMQHVKENYKYPRNKDGKFIRGKATITMLINKEGKVEVQSVKGPQPKVNEAARAMIMKLPTMIPGRRGADKTSIKYTIPLNL